MQSLKPRTGLYTLFLQRLASLERHARNGIIPFPYVWASLCPNFKLRKQQCWDIFFMLQEVGVIEIVPFRGIKITLIYFVTSHALLKIRCTW